jgi:uncharacterized membrane protein YfcA
VILFAAAFVQGLTGFGFGLIAMAFLPLVLKFSETTLLVAVLGLALNVITFWQYRKEYDWRQGWQLILGAALGCPLGTYLLTTLDERLMIRLLGGLITVFSLRELFFVGNLERGLPNWAALPLGALSGLFGSAFNIGGPPAIVYVYSQPWSHSARLALLQVMFLEIGVLRLGLTAAVGPMNRDTLASAAWLFIPLIAAVLFGHWVLSRITPGRLKRPVWIFLLVMGVKYVISP